MSYEYLPRSFREGSSKLCPFGRVIWASSRKGFYRAVDCHRSNRQTKLNNFVIRVDRPDRNSNWEVRSIEYPIRNSLFNSCCVKFGTFSSQPCWSLTQVNLVLTSRPITPSQLSVSDSINPWCHWTGWTFWSTWWLAPWMRWSWCWSPGWRSSWKRYRGRSIPVRSELWNGEAGKK